MKKLLLSALAVSVMFISCNKDDDKPMPKPVKKVDVSAKGVFADIYYIQKNMYDVSSDELINSFNKFKSKIAVTRRNPEETQENFINWIKNVKPEGKASNGKAGKLGKRYLNANGVENGQLIKKGFIGAYQLNNAWNEYQKISDKSSKEELQRILENFSIAILGSYDYIDNEKEEMESHGKKIMGYPAMEGNELAKYLNVVNSYKQYEGISDNLYNALKEAKKNTDNNDSFKKNILTAFSVAQKVTAIRGVQYLKRGANLKEGEELDPETAHAISEGLGFIYSLDFARYYIGDDGNVKLSMQVSRIHNVLAHMSLWDTDIAKRDLETIGKDVAETYEFNYEEANL